MNITGLIAQLGTLLLMYVCMYVCMYVYIYIQYIYDMMLKNMVELE
jgi:hypothetical protein